MKKLLILSGLVFVLCGCTTTPKKISPVITFMTFMNQSKCTYLAQDDVFFEEDEQLVPGFILNLTDFSTGSVANCVNTYQNQADLNAWELHYHVKNGNGRLVRINDRFQNQEGVTVVVTLKVNDKFITSPNETFDISKAKKIEFEVTSISGREVMPPKFTGGKIWYDKQKK